MIFIGVLIGLVIMGGTIYMALNKKSEFKVRVACLIALAVMIVSVFICVIIAFSNTSPVAKWDGEIVGRPLEVKETGGNSVAVVIMLVFLLALFAVIAFLSFKEHKKHAPKKPGINDVYANDGDLEF